DPGAADAAAGGAPTSPAGAEEHDAGAAGAAASPIVNVEEEEAAVPASPSYTPHQGGATGDGADGLGAGEEDADLEPQSALFEPTDDEDMAEEPTFTASDVP
ncbi:unnamed protein product, partial [Prorocentrum cordatum]